METGDATKGIAAQLDLARFYLAWELPHEAMGVIKYIKITNPQASKAPELIGLMGVAQTMAGRGREAIETLSAPEIADDAASQLWASMAALMSGDPIEARKRFARGSSALAGFSPEYKAKFTLNEALAAQQTGDMAGANIYAERAKDLALEPYTKEMAQIIMARASGELGQIKNSN